MRNPEILIFLLSLIQLAKSDHLEQFNYRGGYCVDSEKVSTTSTYSTNIVTVLSNLTSLSFHSKFDHYSAGSGPALVSGLFLCRLDLSSDDCKICVTNLAKDFLYGDCQDRKDAIAWYEECMLRYSNHTLLATEETDPSRWYYSLLNVSQPDVFLGILNTTLEALIVDTVGNAGRYATKSARFTVFEPIYSLAICTPDITATQCEHCLRKAKATIPVCCGGGLSQYTMVFFPSCQLRYDTAPFLISAPTVVP